MFQLCPCTKRIKSRGGTGGARCGVIESIPAPTAPGIRACPPQFDEERLSSSSLLVNRHPGPSEHGGKGRLGDVSPLRPGPFRANFRANAQGSGDRAGMSLRSREGCLDSSGASWLRSPSFHSLPVSADLPPLRRRVASESKGDVPGLQQDYRETWWPPVE